MYRILITAPASNILIAGETRSLQAGDTLCCSEEEGQRLVQGILKNKHQVIEHSVEDQPDLFTDFGALEEGYDRNKALYQNTPIYSESVPTALPTLKDPLQEGYQEYAEDGDKFFAQTQAPESTGADLQPSDPNPEPASTEQPQSEDPNPQSEAPNSESPENTPVESLNPEVKVVTQPQSTAPSVEALNLNAAQEPTLKKTKRQSVP